MLIALVSPFAAWFVAVFAGAWTEYERAIVRAIVLTAPESNATDVIVLFGYKGDINQCSSKIEEEKYTGFEQP